MKHILTIILCLAVTAVAITSCANMGSPDGGRFDETPPVVVKSNPVQHATGVTRKKIDILFDEFIKLENAYEKVIVSPPQMEAANVRADGKHVKITLYDSLKANTTYTVDFSDAIEDNNEGNPMGQYTFSFSTGQSIDTMEVAGTVLAAKDLEPVKGILVGLYPLDSTFTDSTFLKSPLSRVSRTNGSGRFSIKGVANGSYRVFALQDVDGNYTFSQKSEMIAFDTTTVRTWSKPDLRYDTVWHDSIHYDSIMVVPYIHYFPDDIVLRAFLEEGQPRYFLKSERPQPYWFKLYFTAPDDEECPEVRGLNFDASGLLVCPSLHNDTITYWLRDTTLFTRQDTLSFELVYRETDTTGVLTQRIDTLDLVPRNRYSKIVAEREEKSAEWEKDRARRVRKSKKPLPPEDNPYKTFFLDVKSYPSGSLDPNRNVRITSSEPIMSVDSSMVHLNVMHDSVWVPEPFYFVPHGEDNMSYMLYAEWQPKEKYMFRLDSLAMTSVLGRSNKLFKTEFKVRSQDEYGSFFAHLIMPDTATVIVELLIKGDKVVYQQTADREGNADFFYLKPGEYYMRCFIDRNGNGKWDTGAYADGLAPEETFYFPKPIQVRAKWDVEQDWEPRSIPMTSQKPLALTKQKADKEKSAKNRNKQRDEEKRKEKEGK